MPATSPPETVIPYAVAGGTSLLSRLRRAAASAPEALAVSDSRGRALSRSALLAAAAELAPEFTALGAGPGDPVMIMMPNFIEWEVAFVACLLIGALPATLPVTTDPESAAHAAGLAGARLLVTALRSHGAPGDEIGAAVTECLNGRLAWLAVGDGQTKRGKRQAGEALPLPDRLAALDHLMFTSSTTGLPKAVGHTPLSLAAVNTGFAERFALGARSPIFMASPLGHSVGAWHGVRLSLFLGSHLVLQERWDPGEGLALIERHACEFTAAATPFLRDLLAASAARPAGGIALRSFLCGGAPVPPSLVEEAAGKWPSTFVTVLWGMTEGGVTTCRPADPPGYVTKTAGVGLPGLDLAALGPDGTPLAAGEAGEIAMRGPGVFAGYVGQEDLYQASLAPGGWFRTGDLGCVDEDGYLHLEGRLKDLIIRGGVNIAPLPIENAIASHPKVRGVAVIGSPDPRLGERIAAVVVPSGEPPSLAELVDWATRQGLPKRWLPERLWLLDEIPTTPVGKVRKAALRALLFGETEQGS